MQEKNSGASLYERKEFVGREIERFLRQDAEYFDVNELFRWAPPATSLDLGWTRIQVICSIRCFNRLVTSP